MHAVHLAEIRRRAGEPQPMLAYADWLEAQRDDLSRQRAGAFRLLAAQGSWAAGRRVIWQDLTSAMARLSALHLETRLWIGSPSGSCLYCEDTLAILHEFALWMTEEVLARDRHQGQEPPASMWELVEITRRYLSGRAGPGEVHEALACCRNVTYRPEIRDGLFRALEPGQRLAGYACFVMQSLGADQPLRAGSCSPAFELAVRLCSQGVWRSAESPPLVTLPIDPARVLRRFLPPGEGLYGPDVDQQLAFLQAIRSRPEDGEAMLAFADWLEEHGDTRAWPFRALALQGEWAFGNPVHWRRELFLVLLLQFADGQFKRLWVRIGDRTLCSDDLPLVAPRFMLSYAERALEYEEQRPKATSDQQLDYAWELLEMGRRRIRGEATAAELEEAHLRAQQAPLPGTLRNLLSCATDPRRSMAASAMHALFWNGNDFSVDLPLNTHHEMAVRLCSECRWRLADAPGSEGLEAVGPRAGG